MTSHKHTAMQPAPDTHQQTPRTKKSVVTNIISWVFGVCFLLISFVSIAWQDATKFGIVILVLSTLYFIPKAAIKNKIHRFIINTIKIAGVIILISVIGLIGSYKYCYFSTEVDTTLMTELELTTSAGYRNKVSNNKVVEREFYRHGRTCSDETYLEKKIIPNRLILFRNGDQKELGRIIEINNTTYLVEWTGGRQTISNNDIIAID